MSRLMREKFGPVRLVRAERVDLEDGFVEAIPEHERDNGAEKEENFHLLIWVSRFESRRITSYKFI